MSSGTGDGRHRHTGTGSVRHRHARTWGRRHGQYKKQTQRFSRAQAMKDTGRQELLNMGTGSVSRGSQAL